MFDSEGLEQFFVSESLVPLGFNTLLREWIHKKWIIPHHDLMHQSLLNEIIKTLKIWFYDSSQDKPVQRLKFIIIPLLETFTRENFHKLGRQPMDFLEISLIFNISMGDVEILVQFWALKGLVVRKHLKDFIIVKVKGEGLTETDEGIVKIKSTCRNLRDQMNNMERKVIM